MKNIVKNAVTLALVLSAPAAIAGTSSLFTGTTGGLSRAQVAQMGISAPAGGPLAEWLAAHPLTGNSNVPSGPDLAAKITVLKALEPGIVTSYTPAMVDDQLQTTTANVFAGGNDLVAPCPRGMPLFPTGDPRLFRDNPKINGGWFPQRVIFQNLDLVPDANTAPDPYHAPDILLTNGRPVLWTILSNAQGQPLVGVQEAAAQEQSGGMSSFQPNCGAVGWARGCTAAYRIHPSEPGFTSTLGSSFVERMAVGLSVDTPYGSQSPAKCQKTFEGAAQNEFYPNFGYAANLAAHFVAPTAEYNSAGKTVVDLRGRELAVRCWQIASSSAPLPLGIRLVIAGNKGKIVEDLSRAESLYHPQVVDYCAVFSGGSGHILNTANLEQIAGGESGMSFYDDNIAPFPRKGAVRWRHPVTAFFLDPKLAGEAILKAHLTAESAESRYVVRVETGTVRALTVNTVKIGHHMIGDAWLLAFSPKNG